MELSAHSSKNYNMMRERAELTQRMISCFGCVRTAILQGRRCRTRLNVRWADCGSLAGVTSWASESHDDDLMSRGAESVNEWFRRKRESSVERWKRSCCRH